jgi:hypothetical protein
MARYYFHLCDGDDTLCDPDGSDLPDFKAVRARALLSARSIMSADVLDGLLRLDLRIDVEDRSGRLAFRLPFADAVALVPAASARTGRPAPTPPLPA